jgi:hypothetical protein
MCGAALLHWIHEDEAAAAACLLVSLEVAPSIVYLRATFSHPNSFSCLRHGTSISSKSVRSMFALFSNLGSSVTNDHIFKDEYLFYRFTKSNSFRELSDVSEFSSVHDSVLSRERFEEIVAKFKKSVQVADRRYHLKTYKKCFIG